MLNVKRSVERVENVKQVRFDLPSGVASVVFESDKPAQFEQLWQAVKHSGFTPVKIESQGRVYKGPG